MSIELPRCKSCVMVRSCVFLYEIRDNAVQPRTDDDVVNAARGVGCRYYATKDKYAWVGRY